MKADTIRGFFEGRVPASVLAREALVTDRGVKFGADEPLSDDLSEDFTVTPDHLVALCDAVTDNQLKPAHLEVIATVLVRSDRFVWDPTTPTGALVSRVIYAWEAPEINYVLSRQTARKFRTLLCTGENQFDEADWSELPPRKS